MAPYIVLVVVIAMLVLVVTLRKIPKRVIVYEYQKALQYKKGRYVATLGPGQYWISSLSTTIYPMDIRPEFTTVPGQDVLSADGVTVRVSLAAEFQVIDPYLAITRNSNFRASLYLFLQMALREIVSREKVDALVESRAGISARLMELTSAKATEMGLKLISADIKDLMFPGEMKKVFAQVVKAQKEGQAALERARGETAALRNLANAARAIDDNPNLLQLRALQALTDSGGNTLVLGLPPNSVPLVKQNGKNAAPQKKQEDAD